jgi:hypothetical protein
MRGQPARNTRGNLREGGRSVKPPRDVLYRSMVEVLIQKISNLAHRSADPSKLEQAVNLLQKAHSTLRVGLPKAGGQ